MNSLAKKWRTMQAHWRIKCSWDLTCSTSSRQTSYQSSKRASLSCNSSSKWTKMDRRHLQSQSHNLVLIYVSPSTLMTYRSPLQVKNFSTVSLSKHLSRWCAKLKASSSQQSMTYFWTRTWSSDQIFTNKKSKSSRRWIHSEECPPLWARGSSTMNSRS